ncbi:MAG: glycosyl transferase family 28 [Proteobacteria bacterium]|nr:MAG: glycosyl transferase family 28 [Pseudomonadota bacterium]
MIFVAVGTQFSFDRLIQYMDEWARDHDEPVFAQIGEGKYEPEHMQWARFLNSDEYNSHIKNANVFVSHAGMGNIISARANQTPIIVINRQYELGEHRNNHQAEGLLWMGKLPGVYTADSQEALYAQLAQRATLECPAETDNENRQKLVQFLGDYIDSRIS